MRISGYLSYLGIDRTRCRVLSSLCAIVFILYIFIIYKLTIGDVEKSWKKIENGDGLYYVINSYTREAAVNECQLNYVGDTLFESCFNSMTIEFWVHKVILDESGINKNSVVYLEEVKRKFQVRSDKAEDLKKFSYCPYFSVSIACAVLDFANNPNDLRLICHTALGYDRKTGKRGRQSENYTDRKISYNTITSSLSNENDVLILTYTSDNQNMKSSFDDTSSSSVQDQQSLKGLVSRGFCLRKISSNTKLIYRSFPNGILEVSRYRESGVHTGQRLIALRSFHKFNSIHQKAISDLTYAGNFLWAIIPESNKLARIDVKRYMITKIYNLHSLKTDAKKSLYTKADVKVLEDYGNNYEWNDSGNSYSVQELKLTIDYSPREIAYEKTTRTFIIGGSNWNTMYRIKIPNRDMFYKKRK